MKIPCDEGLMMRVWKKIIFFIELKVKYAISTGWVESKIYVQLAINVLS